MIQQPGSDDSRTVVERWKWTTGYIAIVVTVILILMLIHL